MFSLIFSAYKDVLSANNCSKEIYSVQYTGTLLIKMQLH